MISNQNFNLILDNTSLGWLMALGIYDFSTWKHSRRVAEIASSLHNCARWRMRSMNIYGMAPCSMILAKFISRRKSFKSLTRFQNKNESLCAAIRYLLITYSPPMRAW